VLLVSSQGRIAVVETKLAPVEVYGSVKIKFRPTSLQGLSGRRAAGVTVRSSSESHPVR